MFNTNNYCDYNYTNINNNNNFSININNICNNNYNKYNNINNNNLINNNINCNYNYTNINSNFNNNFIYNNLNGVAFNDIYGGFNYINNKNDRSISKYFIVIINYNNEPKCYIKINPEKTIKDLLNEIYLKFYYSNIEQSSIQYNARDLRKIDKSKLLSNFFETLSPKIHILGSNDLVGGGESLLEKEINIRFIKLPRQILDKNIYIFNLFGLLKLCLLKEISLKLNNYQIAQLPIFLSSIMEILKMEK